MEAADNNYELKNLLLAYPADWFVEDKTLKFVKKTLPNISNFYKNEGKENMALSKKTIIQEPLKEVYTVPLFSKTFCELLLNELKSMQEFGSFKPNDSEDELRQIPEIIISEYSQQLNNSLLHIVDTILNPIFINIWNRHVTAGNIQIANYNIKEKVKGAWHHDASADISVVVPLNTGEYIGGGTEFFNRGIIEPLPSGNALIFPSFTHMHRGLPVEAGDRYLLVFWLVCEEATKGNRNYMKNQ